MAYGTMKGYRITILLVGASAACACTAGFLLAEDRGSAKTAAGGSGLSKLNELAWIAGHWEGGDGENRLEEFWSEPAGDSMMGVFRWIKGEKTWMYEILSFTAEGDDVYYRLRHFNSPKLTAWEEKDGALFFKLIKVTPDEAVFENPERELPRRMIFLKTGDNTVTHRLEGIRDGKDVADEFLYKRVGK